MMPTLYIASKVRHAPRWRALRAAGWRINSRWLDYPDGDLDADQRRRLWLDCIADATAADMLIVYAELGDVLKGGLIEAGAALGAGVPVYQVGTSSSLEAGDGSDASFSGHPLWRKVASFEEAVFDWQDRHPAERQDAPTPTFPSGDIDVRLGVVE